MSQHTPGPWKLDRPIYNTHAWITGGDNTQPFIKMFLGQPRSHTKDPELEANFNLVMASPELLGALKELLADHLETLEDPTESEQLMIQRCLDAIAKAEGPCSSPTTTD